ncbi:MAG: hypothetical protein V3T58_00365 [Candidatus Hydrothermarchaeales archaeon]
MKSPCELVVWYVLPSIKSELAKELVDRGLNQREVSQRLGMTEAAVSQYMKKKRGSKIALKKGVKKAISELAEKIVENKEGNMILDICRICGQVKADRTLCGPHKQHALVPEGCDACFIPGK